MSPSICRRESLDEVIAAVAAGILLRVLGSIRPRQRLNQVLEVGVAKVANIPALELAQRQTETFLHHPTYAMLYREGYVVPSFLGGSTTL